MKAQAVRCSKATKDPATKQPATKQPATKQPATKQPATKQPATKQPATKQQATKHQATKQQATKQQATKQQATKQQAMKQPATKQSATKDQATKEQVAKQAPSSSSPPCQSAQDRSKILKAALLNMAKRQPKSPEVHFFLALHFLREHQPAKALSAFEAAAAAVAALPEERMSQPRRDLHSAAHRHMAQVRWSISVCIHCATCHSQVRPLCSTVSSLFITPSSPPVSCPPPCLLYAPLQCHLELAMLAAPAAAETDPHHHHHNQHLNASQQQHPHKQQKQHQQNHQQQQQQHAAHANDADVAGGAPITVHKQSSSKVQGKAQGKDQVNAQGKVEGKVQAKAQLKGPRRGAKMQQQAQKKGEKRGKREREKAETGLMRPAEKHGEEWSLPEMDQEGGLSGKRKFEGEGAIEGVTNGLDELDGLLGLAGLVEEEAEGREAKRVCSALDMFAAVADLELRREERLREERQREEACLLQQDSVGSLKKAAERGGMATTNHLAVMLLLYGRTEKALDVLSQQLASVETGTSGDAAGSTGSTASPTAPIDTDTLANLGAALLHVGRYDEAAACLQAVLQREPQHPAALCSYSALLLATQR
ncbi:unnamed protein product, partial [Closterium sp. Naga37s-1]